MAGSCHGEPIVTALDIGIDSFAYHRYFGDCNSWETPISERWTTSDFLRRAAVLGVGAVSLQTLYLPELTASVDTLRDELTSLNLAPTLAWGHPDGLQGGTNPERFAALRALLPKARDLGCRTVRFTCGSHFFFHIPAAERRARLLPLLKMLVADAAALDLILAVENHADFAMADLVAMVREVDDPHLGICFDTGNAVRVGDDLLAAARLAAPVVRMVHIKDMIVIPESRGDPTRWWPTVPLGRGEFDLAGFVAVLRQAGYAGTLFIELANMHKGWPDEDAAVAESVAYLRTLLAT
jgi:sugar phosphate isomerase/epimerase